jgi:hypothetical protein
MSVLFHSRLRAGLVAGVTVAALSTLFSMQVAHAAHAAPDPQWTRLSSGNVGTQQQPSVHRFGRDLQVVWTQPDGQLTSMWTRILGADGNPTGPAERILRWQTLIPDPVIFAIGAKRYIVFAGMRTSNVTDPYSTGAEYYLTSADGRSWTLGSGSLSASERAAGSYGTAAIGYKGSPLVAFTEASASRITFHRGIDPNSPATQPDGQTAGTGNFAYDTALGEDASTSDVWALWYSNSGKRATNGVVAQRLFPMMGSLVNAPASSTTAHGTATSTAPDQDLPAVSRSAASGGGVYTAYATPKANAITVWRVGARRPAFTIKATFEIGQVSLAAGPAGRLWIFWRNGTGQLQATRTNKAATRVGAIRDVPRLRGATVYRTAGDGSRGPLDLVSLMAAARGAMDSIQVLPGLTGSAGRIWKQGHSYAVTVTDAGAPVSGALVRFAGHSAKSNRHGLARFTVSRHQALKRSTVTVSHRGYAGVDLQVSVRG